MMSPEPIQFKTSRRELEAWAARFSRNPKAFPAIYGKDNESSSAYFDNDSFRSRLEFAPDGPEYDSKRLHDDAVKEAQESRKAVKGIAIASGIGFGISAGLGIAVAAGALAPLAAFIGLGASAFLGLAALSNLANSHSKMNFANQLQAWNDFLAAKPDPKKYEPPPPPPPPPPAPRPMTAEEVREANIRFAQKMEDDRTIYVETTRRLKEKDFVLHEPAKPEPVAQPTGWDPFGKKRKAALAEERKRNAEYQHRVDVEAAIQQRLHKYVEDAINKKEEPPHPVPVDPKPQPGAPKSPYQEYWERQLGLVKDKTPAPPSTGPGKTKGPGQKKGPGQAKKGGGDAGATQPDKPVRRAVPTLPVPPSVENTGAGGWLWQGKGS